MDELMTDITEIVGNLTSRFIDELTRIIAAKDATIETLRARVQELAAEAYVSGNNIEQLRAELAKHTFKCPEFVYGGPGHQSKHECKLRFPHPRVGEHDAGGGREWEVTEDDKDETHFTDVGWY